MAAHLKTMFTVTGRQIMRKCRRVTSFIRGVMPPFDVVDGVPLPAERRPVHTLQLTAQVSELKPAGTDCSEVQMGQIQQTGPVEVGRPAYSNSVTGFVGEVFGFFRKNFVRTSRQTGILKLATQDGLLANGDPETYRSAVSWQESGEEFRCHFHRPKLLRYHVESTHRSRPACCVRHYEKEGADSVPHRPPPVKGRASKMPLVIYVAGGLDADRSLDLVEAYEVEDRSWYVLPNMPHCRSWIAGAFLKGMFYVVGFNFELDWSGVDRYDPSTRVWQPVTPMTFPRISPGVAVLDGCLYIVGGGGQDGAGAERYDPDTGRWTRLPPMSAARDGLTAAVVDRLLYAIGGLRQSAAVADVECYNPDRGEWTRVAPLNVSRFAAAAAALDRHVYVAGGRNMHMSLYAVERYDTGADAWEIVSGLRVPRTGLTLTAAGGKLYAMGGTSDAVFDSTEVYDPQRGFWEDGVQMTKARYGHAAALAN